MKNTIVLLNVLATMISRSINIPSHLPSLISLLRHYDSLFQDNDEGLLAIKAVTRTVLEGINAEIKSEDKNEEEFIHIAFQILITVQATRTIAENHRQEAGDLLVGLAKLGGYASVSELHGREIIPILDQLVEKR